MITPDQHQLAAEEVWNAFDAHLRAKMSYHDFMLGFKFGRISMKATMDKAESPKQPDKQPAAK